MAELPWYEFVCTEYVAVRWSPPRRSTSLGSPARRPSPSRRFSRLGAGLWRARCHAEGRAWLRGAQERTRAHIVESGRAGPLRCAQTRNSKSCLVCRRSTTHVCCEARPRSRSCAWRASLFLPPGPCPTPRRASSLRAEGRRLGSSGSRGPPNAAVAQQLPPVGEHLQQARPRQKLWRASWARSSRGGSGAARRARRAGGGGGGGGGGSPARTLTTSGSARARLCACRSGTRSSVAKAQAR